ncbi:transcription factor TFIIIB component B'' homolog isoform X2 [Morone saxatilis]|uniref:transcription factor TFIIIB component B'' homolog isoform X2 n=1 Tax=Morone saxatilis TaxID=34816 RepID=UPI0015E2216B|nr:transcription factor TFIIIB component B'' homolog isoform X2 [Morone saxatilis]
MFRRSRFSVRPNVGTAGRTTATSQEAPTVNQEASETPKDVSESSTATAVTDKSVVTPSEKRTAPGDTNDQNGESASSSAAVQRRKRFSIKPKVAPGRPAAVARTPKSPVKAVSETPVEVSAADLDKPTTSSKGETSTAPLGLQSPRRRRASEESKQPKVPPKPTLIPSDSPGLSAVPPAEDLREQTEPLAESGKQLESTSDGQVKEVPPRLPDKVPPSLPDKEAIEISEKAKTLVSSKSGLSLSQPAFSLSRLLNDPSDLQRIAKARKLRELLRQEMHKEKKSKRAKARAKEYTLDPAKMTMRDLIRYLPVSNPMTSSLEDPAPENETVVPFSPGREESPERAQEPEVTPKISSPRQEEEEEEVDVAAEDEQEDALMVPQVKVAEDGSLIIDEESLTVEVLRAKGPNPAQERDPIFERGSTTTYSSFRKGTYSKPWSSEETDMFFLAISMVGTDFSMICQLFPHRARSEIKNKFKKEERVNAWRIDKAFRERRKLDIEYFSKLLEKILEVQKNRKKLKLIAEKNSPKKQKRKAKAKKAANKLSDVEEEDEEGKNGIPDLEEEGEKENEDLCNEGGTPVSKPKKKRKRKNTQDASTEEPNDKKNKTVEKSSEQDEAYIPEDAEAALPEDHTNSDMSEKTENMNAAKDTAIKPAKLSRGRAPKPLLPLGRKWGKKAPPPSSKAKDTASEKGDESASDGASKEQVNKDASPIRQAEQKTTAKDDVSSEEEDATVQPLRPTRYGRVPKPTKPLTYPAKEDAHSSASETTPASPAGSTVSAAKPKPKCTAKRGRTSKPQPTQESKKPKLVTLRASQSEYSDEENENQWEEEEVEEDEHPESNSSIAPAFVPASLRSPHPVISEVEETMEELDILANMPDVLGISQDALCPDASCELAQNETGTAESCEHQLDLLVDVIDFLSSEPAEESEDESYNEAAQTLLTIGNLAHLCQSAQNQTTIQDHTTGTTSISVDETSQHLEVEIASKPAAQEENSATPLMSATSSEGVPETSETVATVELQHSTTENSNLPITETTDQKTGSDIPESSQNNSPQTRKGRISKVKPKPNLGQASRTARSKSQPDTSTGRTAEESRTVAPKLSEVTETLSAAKDTPVDCCQKLSKDEISCIEVNLTEEPSGSQERSVGQVKLGAATSDPTASENQSHTPSEPSLEQATSNSTRVSTDKILMSHVGTTKSSCNLLTSDTAVTELQGTNMDSVPVQLSSDHPAPCVTPVKDLPASQKEESEEASIHQTRRSRFQRVKPKPSLAQTSRAVHSKLQTKKDTVEKNSNPTPNPKFNEKTIEEDETEPTCTTSPEKPSQSSTGLASDLIPSLDSGSTLTPPTEELSTTVDKKTDDGNVFHVESDAATSNQSASGNEITRPTSESIHEKLVSHVETDDSSYPLTSDSAVPKSQVGQESDIHSAPVQEISDHPSPWVTHVEELSVSQKEESKVTSTCQQSKLQSTKDPVTNVQLMDKPSGPASVPESTDNTIAEVEAQPTCSTTPTQKPCQIKSTGTSVSVPSLVLCSTLPKEELSLTGDQKTNVGSALDSSSEGSEQNATQRRRRFPKVKPKPNLGPSTRTTQTKLRTTVVSTPSEQHHMDTSSSVTSEQQPVDNNNAQTELKLAEEDSQRQSLDGKNDEGTSSDGIVITTSSVAENQSELTDSVIENKTNEKPTVEVESTGDKVETIRVSQGDCKQDRTTETNTQPSDNPIAISDVQSSEDGSTESKIKSILLTNTQSTPAPKESTPISENASEAQSQDAVQQCSETPATNQITTQSTDDNTSKSADSSQSSRKAPQTRRGRLVKPKPNLRRSSQPSQPQKVQNIKQAEADSGICAQSADASVFDKPVSELQPDIQELAEGAIEQHSSQNCPPSDAVSSLGCLTQVTEQLNQQDSPSKVAGASLGCVTEVPDNSAQDASASSTGGIQSHPSLTIFPDLLSEQVPSDPDEPFFILSLTEIPVCSTGEVVDCVSEPLPYLPVADASIQQQSVSGESLAAAGHGLSNVAVPVSMEESGETGLINAKDTGPDPATYIGSIMENPVDPHESTTVQSSILPETVENNDKTEHPPTKQRLMGTGRTAKLQAKPKTQRKKQASKTLTAKEAEPICTQDSERPGPSVQPKDFDEVVTEPQKGSDDREDTEKETLTSGNEVEDHSSGAQTTQTRGTRSRNRNPKGFPSSLAETDITDPSSSSPSCKAASKGSKVKTPRAARKRSTPAPVASTSYDVAPSPSPTQPPEDTHFTPSTTSPTQTEVDMEQTSEHSRLCSTPNTFLCPAEVPASRHSDDVESTSIEEPTSVSQYFLSDIFTEVEEG